MASSWSGHLENLVDEAAAQDFLRYLFGFDVIGPVLYRLPDLFHHTFAHVRRGLDQLLDMLHLPAANREFHAVAVRNDVPAILLLKSLGLLLVNIQPVRPRTQV